MNLKWMLLTILFSAVLSCQTNQDSDESLKQAHIIRHLVVYSARDEYCAWPSIVRAKTGDLLVAFCRTEEHVSPNGAIVLMRSRNNSESWEGPSVMYDSPIDDRESGLTVLRDDRIIAHFYSYHHTKERYATTYAGSYEQPVLDRWAQYVEQPAYKKASELQGAWISVTNDAGDTWSKPVRGMDTIHGGIQLSDGSLMVASYREYKGNIGVFAAQPEELAWEQITTIHCPQSDTLRFGEPHILQLPSGRVIMMLRSTAIPYDDSSPHCVLWETYSDDNGRTWAKLYPTPLWGFPPHLLLLSDGRILCTYGYRRPPFGQRACVSEDGITWDKKDEIILRDDAFNNDLGYPASIELEPGIVLSVYYQSNPADGPQQMNPPDPNRWKPDILGTIWKVPKPQKK